MQKTLDMVILPLRMGKTASHQVSHITFYIWLRLPRKEEVSRNGEATECQGIIPKSHACIEFSITVALHLVLTQNSWIRCVWADLGANVVLTRGVLSQVFQHLHLFFSKKAISESLPLQKQKEWLQHAYPQVLPSSTDIRTRERIARNNHLPKWKADSSHVFEVYLWITRNFMNVLASVLRIQSNSWPLIIWSTRHQNLGLARPDLVGFNFLHT